MNEALDFRAALALAVRIEEAGYPVDVIACREEGRLVGWYILFRGRSALDSRVYRVASDRDWEEWGKQERTVQEHVLPVGGRYLGSWVLDEAGTPRQEPDVVAAWRWREQHPTQWKLGHDELPAGTVSTVFLPLDHQLDPEGPPLLWETMCFRRGTFSDFYRERYPTRDEALSGHKRIVEALRSGEIRPPDDEDQD